MTTLTVKQLIAVLQLLDPDLPVYAQDKYAYESADLHIQYVVRGSKDTEDEDVDVVRLICVDAEML